jgi:hypothetical protein
LSRAANIRFVHTDASTHAHLPELRAFAPRLATLGTGEAKLNVNCIGTDILYPTFLPPFPYPSFANQGSR